MGFFTRFFLTGGGGVAAEAAAGVEYDDEYGVVAVAGVPVGVIGGMGGAGGVAVVVGGLCVGEPGDVLELEGGLPGVVFPLLTVVAFSGGGCFGGWGVYTGVGSSRSIA